MATLFTVDGKASHIDLTDQDTVLAKLQEAVGGYIELVQTPEDFLIVNEEGVLKNLPQNPSIEPFLGPVVKLTAEEMAVL
jgi:hypothetical protein